MGYFTLSRGPDTFTPATGVPSNESNLFEISQDTLQGTDTVTGGAAGGFIDSLVVAPGSTFAAAQFGGVTNIEQLVVGGDNVTLLQSAVQGSSLGYFVVSSAGGNNVVDGSGVSSQLVFNAGPGNDVFKGGSGNDTFQFSPSRLDSNDIVQGGAGFDILFISSPGMMIAPQFSGVSGIDELSLVNGANNVTLLQSMVQGTSLPYFTVATTGGTNIVDGSGVSTALVFAAVSGTGNDTFTGGTGNDTFLVAASDLSAADTFSGGAGFDTLFLSTMGTVTAAQFAGVSGLEQLALTSGV